MEETTLTKLETIKKELVTINKEYKAYCFALDYIEDAKNELASNAIRVDNAHVLDVMRILNLAHEILEFEWLRCKQNLYALQNKEAREKEAVENDSE